MTELSPQELIKAIQNADNQALTELYEKYRQPFIVWSQQYFGCDSEEAADVFQEVVIVFYRNVAKGKLTVLTSSVKTYLFAIGKNILLNRQRKQKNVLPLNETLPIVDDFIIEQQFENSDTKTMLRKAVEQLGKPCSDIIKLFYYRSFAIEAIQKRLGYNSESVVRTQKKRCMEYLRKLVKNIENEGA